jgi:hypothetical protein
MTKWNDSFKWIVAAMAVVALICLFAPLGKDVFIKIFSVGIITLAIYYFIQFEKDTTERFHIAPWMKKIKIIGNKIKSLIFSVKFKQIAQYTFLICLLLVVLISLEKTLSQWQNIPAVLFLSKIIDGLKNVNTPLVIIAIISGFFTFFLNREKIQNETEEKKNNEEAEEQKRKAKFPQKYPKINKIPIIRNFVRWMCKEGWGYSVGIILVLVFASLLIYPNLGSHDIYHDESWHINVIDSLAKGDGFHLRNYVTDEPTTNYDQGYLTNLGSYFFYSQFPGSLFWMRFFVATISLLNLLLIYLIFKSYVPKLISLLITFFISYNIIFLYLARFLRPYPLFLFFYLFVFLLLIKLPEHMKNKNIKFLYISLLGIFLFSIGALIEREVAKILFILLPLCFIPIIIKYRGAILKLLSNIDKKLIFAIIFFVISIPLLLDFFNIVHLSIIFKQIPQQFSLQIILNPNNIYYHYLLDKQMRTMILSSFLFGFGMAYLVYTSIAKKKFNTSCLLCFALVPLIINAYLMKSSEDFRYIYYLIPFFLPIIILGIYAISILIFNKNSSRIIFNVFCLIFIVSIPMIPFLKEPNFLFLKSITEWDNYDGKTYLHARAVPPDYTLAYDYLNENQRSGDIAIINEASWNIKPNETVEYYHLDNLWTYSKNIINFRDNANVDFFDLIKENRGRRVWFLGAYVHMTDNTMNEYLLKNCDNVAKKLNIKVYNYNSYYGNRFYWPNLFLCE